MTIVRWFLSKTVREALAMRKHVWKLLQHQRDILAPEAVQGMEAALQEVRAAVQAGVPMPVLKTQMLRLEEAANTWLKPYAYASWRENIEVLLVALAVAMGIRTFLLQPFKIPTGSMQPTLYGVTSVPDYSRPPTGPPGSEAATTFTVPSGLERVRDWFAGSSYVRFTADQDGQFEGLSKPLRFLIFNVKQTLYFAGQAHTLWFPPDGGGAELDRRMGLRAGQFFKRGQDVLRLKVVSGDHLFVDRLTYNFRQPDRGEIIVFETKGITGLPQDQFYIKRCVALGGNRVQVGDDRHLRIDGRRLDASTPHFEMVYSFATNQAPRDSQYSGHVNQAVARAFNHPFDVARLFPDESTVYDVPPRYLMVMGDNTMNSLDSRSWGAFPATNVIGCSWFVYWPISQRFGWGQR